MSRLVTLLLVACVAGFVPQWHRVVQRAESSPCGGIVINGVRVCLVLRSLVVQSNESQLSHVSVSELLEALQMCHLKISDVQPTVKAAMEAPLLPGSSPLQRLGAACP